MKRHLARLLLPMMLAPVGVLGTAGIANAQFSVTRFDFLGRSAPSVILHGAEFARDDTLSSQLRLTRSGDIIRVAGFGHVLLLPLDRDQQRAASEFNTVQLDAERVNARTATLINGKLYLPLDTLARGLGAQYEPGKFTLPQAELTGVSSHAGRDADRVVLDLNRDVRYDVRVTPSEVRVVLYGARGAERTYTTRGRHLPRVQVARQGGNLVLSAPLGKNDGYRVYRTPKSQQVRLVLDVGPGIVRNLPALAARAHKPLIVLDPVGVDDSGQLGDVALEVAREAGELLSSAGWQVRLTRAGKSLASLAERADLARESDVFLTLDVGRFPGASGSGLTVYEHGGPSGVALLDNVRQAGERDLLSRMAVSDSGANRRLVQLLQGEFKALDVPAKTASVDRLYLLREAPHVALLVQLGWVHSDADSSRLRSEGRRREISVALARGIATYLSARAAGGTP